MLAVMSSSGYARAAVGQYEIVLCGELGDGT